MVSKKVVLKNPEGLHLRTGGKFVEEMNKFQSSVTIIFNDSRIDGKSLINIILACIKCGAEIEIECSGDDEQQALLTAVDVLEQLENE